MEVPMRIFGKQLLLYLSILVISLIFLGLVLSRAISGYLTDQRMDALTDSAGRVARSVESILMNMQMYGDINMDPLALQIENLNDLLDASVAIITVDYTVLFSDLVDGTSLPVAYLEAVMRGETVVLSGSFHPYNPEPLLIAGHPFIWHNRIEGAVLVSISMAELEATIAGMYRMTLISLLVAVLFGSVLVYMSSRAITRPLRQMNEAAGVIAGGVFEKRIAVKSKDELGQLATQFNTMAESLHVQEKIRRSFIANLSHDIRSPLTSMLGFMKAIQDGTVQPEQQPYYMGIVLDETERLIKLSNDLLDIHHLQDSEPVLSKTIFDINKLIRKTIMGFEQRATEKKITVTSRFAHATDMVLADEDKIQRCLHNLLDNAVKFTPEVGEITVETTVTDKKVSVSVTDNGRGMDPEEQMHVFDRFFKGDQSRNEDKRGSGLGLSIAQEFIRAHGENLTLVSAPNKGSTFLFTLAAAEYPNPG